MKIAAIDVPVGATLRDGRRVVQVECAISPSTGAIITVRFKLESSRGGVKVRRWSTFRAESQLEVRDA